MRAATGVMITGGAALTSCGAGYAAFLAGLRAGDSGADRVGGGSGAATRLFPLSVGAASPRTASDHPLVARLLATVEQDLGGFLEALSDEARERTGVAIGSAYGHLGPYLDYFRTAAEQGYRRVNPTHFPATLPNFCATEVSRAFTLWGSCTALASGVAAGLEAIGYAADAVRRGGEQAMLAGGIDDLNAASEVAARRAGTDAGEGIALALLQSAAAARASGRAPLAEIAGSATARGIHGAHGVHVAAAAVRRALAQAELAPGDVGALFPSADGACGERFDAALRAELFGARAERMPVVAVTHATGDCFAATGALQCLAAAARVAPAAASGGAPESDIEVALVWAAGFDGTFATLVIRRPDVS